MSFTVMYLADTFVQSNLKKKKEEQQQFVKEPTIFTVQYNNN